MSPKSLRIISLLPSTTEIACALGLKKHLVGRSHECDYPSGIRDLPVCTEPKFDPDGTSYQIDQRVKALLQEGLSVYRVKADLIAELKPDVILTQDHCEVCAASLPEVKQAVKQIIGYEPNIVSVSPSNLEEVFESIRTIAEATGTESDGFRLIQQMRKQFRNIQRDVKNKDTHSITCLEWFDPLMTAGNWVPELVDIAGGSAGEAEAGEHSPQISWRKVVATDPDVLAVMPCGYGIRQTLAEIGTLTSRNEWDTLKAVENERVYILDGNQYFNRPGPRLTDSARILAEILHPGYIEGEHLNSGWIPLAKAEQYSE